MSRAAEVISKGFVIWCDILENEGRWKHYVKELKTCRKKKNEKKFYIVE